MKKLALTLGLATIMSLSLVGCGGGSSTTYVDGTYEGTGAGEMSDITVSVTVTDGEISSVDIVDHDETEGISDPAFETVSAEIVEKNSTDVDVVAGATGTSNGIMEAVANALDGQTE